MSLVLYRVLHVLTHLTTKLKFHEYFEKGVSTYFEIVKTKFVCVF